MRVERSSVYLVLYLLYILFLIFFYEIVGVGFFVMQYVSEMVLFL